jgi:hypothetical protein
MLVAGLELRAGGRSVDPAATYAIASNEFVFRVVKSVCDTLGLPIMNIALQDSVTEYQVLVQHIIDAQQVSPLAEGRVRCSSITSAEAPVRAPEDFRFSCHPQPASTLAVFSYTLPETAAVRIALYDGCGRRVSDESIGGEEPGTHLRGIAVDRLPAGVYLAALTAGGRTQCIRLLVVR